MLRIVNASDQLIAARLVELLDPGTAWHRALWCLGIVLTLREILEAAEAHRAGILSDVSVERLGIIALRLAGKDAGVRNDEKRGLAAALKGAPRFEGLAYHTVAHLANRIEADYLPRWAIALDASPGPQVERAARSIAAHLLDRGFSGAFLHTWWTHRLYKDTAPLTLGDLCRLAHDQLATRPSSEYEVLVAFRKAPRSASGYPTGWLRADALVRWLQDNGLESSNVRASGGMLLTIVAHDAAAAVALAADRIDQFIARSSIAATGALQPWPAVWVKGEPLSFPFGPRPRGVRVKALYREDQIFNVSASNVDAAIELLAHLETSSPSAAVAGGWAAIEALLGEPGDRASAADNLAAIVACSFPRAELTGLSYTCQPLCPDLAPSLQRSGENRERALVVANAILQGHTLNLLRQTDRASHRRMKQLLESPSKGLTDLHTQVADAFHRLYRERNLILHGGKTDSVALHGSLRTTAKLVGAGMDRITHAWYVKQIRPLELAARARAAILLARENDAPAFVDLLGV